MFDDYRTRLGQRGSNNREAISAQSIMIKEKLFENTQSYKSVYIDGKSYDARITTDVADNIRSGDGNYKIEFRNGQLFQSGTYVQIENAFGQVDTWMIMDVLDDLFFPKHLIKKCTYCLKWKNSNGDIISRWIAFNDSYRLEEGIRYYDNKTVLPDGSIIFFISYDSETALIDQDDRFIIDAEIYKNTPDCYKVTNRSVTRLIDGKYGIITLFLQRTQFNPNTDNAELMIADYFDDKLGQSVDISQPIQEVNIDIIYSGNNRIVMGTPYKEYRIMFTDNQGAQLDIDGVWELYILPEFKDFILYEINHNVLRIKALSNENLVNYKLKATARNIDNSISKDLEIKVVSGI